MSKKPKPATAGEKIVLSWWAGLTDLSELRDEHNQNSSETRDVARRIDAAILRAVRKERERCIACQRAAGYGVSIGLMYGSKP